VYLKDDIFFRSSQWLDPISMSTRSLTSLSRCMHKNVRFWQQVIVFKNGQFLLLSLSFNVDSSIRDIFIILRKEGGGD